MKFSFVRVALTAAFVLTAPAPVLAQTEVRLASVAPEGTPWIDSMTRYRDAVAANSDGSLAVQLYPSGQLGDELQTLAQIRRGRIEGGFVSSAALAGVVPEVAMVETPFLWTDAEELDAVIDGALFDAFQPLFAERDLILVDLLEVGWVHILANRPVILPEDARDLRPRAIETAASQGFWRRLDANAVALPYTDVLPSLQTGLVNGTDNELVSIFFSEFFTAAPHLTLTYHSYNFGALVLSKRWFDSLPPEEQAALMKTPEGERARSRDEVRGLQEWILSQMGEAGVSIVELDDAQRAAWETAMDGFEAELAETQGGASAEIAARIAEAKAAVAAGQ